MDLARRRGVHFGPQKAEIPDGFEEIYLKWNHGKITANMAMQKLGMMRQSTLTKTSCTHWSLVCHQQEESDTDLTDFACCLQIVQR